jgi:hypothetical protein
LRHGGIHELPDVLLLADQRQQRGHQPVHTRCTSFSRSIGSSSSSAMQVGVDGRQADHGGRRVFHGTPRRACRSL